MRTFVWSEPRQPYRINMWTAKTLRKRYGRGERFRRKPIENESLQKQYQQTLDILF